MKILKFPNADFEQKKLKASFGTGISYHFLQKTFSKSSVWKMFIFGLQGNLAVKPAFVFFKVKIWIWNKSDLVAQNFRVFNNT